MKTRATLLATLQNSSLLSTSLSNFSIF